MGFRTTQIFFPTQTWYANTVGPFVDKNKPFSAALNGRFIMDLIAISNCIW